MLRIRAAVVTLLVSLMIGSASVASVAQDAPNGLEGPDWQLTQYTADGALVAVPGDVTATLQLLDGQASGSAGCNSFFGTYAVDGPAISFDEDFGQTSMLCEGDAQMVEDAYLAALPTISSWAIADSALSLLDADGNARLVYGTNIDTADQTDTDRILALLAQMQAQMSALDARIVALEGGGTSGDSAGNSEPKLKKPSAPKAKGGKVKTVFPDWMRDAFRPESERSDEQNREIVTWTKGKGGAIDGSRIYARRGYCTLKPGVDAAQELDPNKDFTTRTGKTVLIDEVPAGTKRYRPNHAQIDALLAAAPESPYSNDQYYDLLVATFNAKGESAKTKVASYYLTPEFRCP